MTLLLVLALVAAIWSLVAYALHLPWLSSTLLALAILLALSALIKGTL